MENQLNAAVFGDSLTGSDITLKATITNVNAVVFQPANVHLHVTGGWEDMGDGGQFPGVESYADIPANTLKTSDLPKADDDHGTLVDDTGALYRILAVDQHGSKTRLYLSSQVIS